MEEKNKTDFERLLQAAQIPFKKLIENSTKNKELFFIEYTKAEKVPDYFLYLRQYYTEDEINEHITGNSNRPAHESGTNGSARVFELPELDKRRNEIDQELRGKHIKGELPDEFYRPDIMQTNTAKYLQEVKDELDILENYTLWSGLDIHKEAEIRGESVLLALKKINNPDLALEILESVVNDDENKILTIQSSALFNKRIPSTIWDTWRALKANFNLILGKGKVQFSNTEESEISSSPPPKHLQLRDSLTSYGFFDLEKVKELTEEKKDTLIINLSGNDIPYIIAMFEYLEFLDHLKKDHFNSNYKLYKELAQWLGCAERTIKGNILVLNDKSKEDRSRYTAHEYRLQVENIIKT